jgi:hypothetical protein
MSHLIDLRFPTKMGGGNVNIEQLEILRA